MRRLYYTKEVLESWKNCMERGIDHNAKAPLSCVSPKELQERQKRNHKLITVLERNLGLVNDLMPGEATFLLVDDNGILIKKNML